MIESPSKSGQQPQKDPHGISKWTRAYAQNRRSLVGLVFLMIAGLLAAAIGGSSYLAGVAYRSGNMLLFWASIAVLVPALGAVVYISIPKWCRKLQGHIEERLFGKEGNVAFSAPGERAKIWAIVLGACFGTCILAHVMFGFAFDIPSKYRQPISALYSVPFLVGLWFLMRPTAGYAALLWPALYATHAILILSGAPILFTGRWDWLNMLIPVFGYGMLSNLVGHLYSRVAFRRLKRLTRADLTGADRPEEASGS